MKRIAVTIMLAAIMAAPAIAGEKWETIVGIQQGIKLATDIDVNSIQRSSDGASASVMVKLASDDIERIVYICRAPSSGMHGAILLNGQITDLAFGTTGDHVMRRVCGYR